MRGRRRKSGVAGAKGGEGSNGLGGGERGIKRTKHAGAIVTRRKRESARGERKKKSRGGPAVKPARDKN